MIRAAGMQTQTRRMVVAVGFAASLVTALSLAAQQPRSVWAGVYSADQAMAGEKIYFDRCASCHGDDLAGLERAPALTGSQFLDAWHGKSVRRLLDRIETMPPNEPIRTAEAVDVLAFLLRSSEMPPGSARLPADRSQLNEITFERTKP
jgi:S-disulfanyl-L-cysteine oxidoreductase SoxD